MQWNLYKCGVFWIQCSKRLQSMGGKYVTPCQEDAKTYQTLQIYGFVLWSTVYTREYFGTVIKDMECK